MKVDKVYHLKWVNGLWTTEDMADFIVNHEESALWDYRRDRVTDGVWLSLEYVINHLSESSFKDAMENYLYGKKLVFEWTGYKHDLKSVNPNMGKKKAFKKSQMRTLMFYVILPGVFVGTVLILLTLLCLCSCLQRCFCKQQEDESAKVKDD